MGNARAHLSEFRSYHYLGSVLNPHLHRRVFVWEKVPHSLLPESLSKDFYSWSGWVRIKNNNGMLVFRNELGSVTWYKSGLVRLYLKGSKLAEVKELLCKAFGWLGPKEVCKFVDCPLRENSIHWVFDVDASVPRFDIERFKRSDGIRIYSDKSHPNSVEVEETVPFWVRNLQDRIDRLSKLIREMHQD